MTEKNNPKNNKKRNNSTGSSSSSAQGLDKVSKDLVRRLPPQNLEAEQAVLGGVFLRNAVFHSLIDLLVEDDFYSPAHRIIYRTFQDLYRQNTPIDLLTVSEHLRKTEELDAVGGPVYLTSLTESVASAANAEHYAQIVKEKAVRRALIQVGSDMITRSFESGAELEGLLDNAQQEVFAVAEAKSRSIFQPTRELVKDVFEQLEKRVERQELVTGVATGYHKFDELTAGLQPTDLIIVAGRPAMGKTAFALNMGMRSAAMFEVPTAVFSLEMSKQQLMMRMLCSWGKVDLKNLRSGFLGDEDWARLYQSADDLAQAPMYIDDTPALGVMEMRARCRRLKAEKGLGLVIVDYLQLMRASRNIDSREQEISDISRNLKALAKEMDVPVVALAQLNRKVEERTNKRPMISDLRESGAIEQDADLIVFLYREDAYNKNEDNPKKGIAEVIIGKQRNGPTGTVELSFLDRYTAFENLAHVPEPSEAS
ncbi:replicative DNA helicase [Desulfohalobium retbaense]|uniref:Replicative DNA helicase n=1 Tax=Desulfohalobium retbaense (strain ATCC 49708 / DSM 5692 / JCM 16813 / HR100) TaxID=485915 RepID=C8X262_DESRD|nr:replicative DNA helicase [Desulfohalobium retbaense]ACV68385.1 replicative DNA helicase [Desulfohalobium retbaense DSM 5692]